MLLTAALAASLYVGGVAAHGGVIAYSIDGKYYDGWKPYNSASGQTSIQRPWATFDPILDATSSTLACNNDGLPGPLQLTASPVAAGSKVTGYWNTWPHDTGPVITYLSQCPSSGCTSVNAQTAKWFKIQEAGLLGGTVEKGNWAAGAMIANNNSWTTTIPSTVPSGHYLIRFETIALHSMPAQFYPECAQIEITGGGSLAPSADQLVTFPGGYKASDPGVTIDIYGQAAKTQTTYVIPGPRLYGSSGGSNPPTPTTTTAPVLCTPPYVLQDSTGHPKSTGCPLDSGPTCNLSAGCSLDSTGFD
ncbi:hypothetical protein FA13DRAFT_1641619 [Coprinellus micaceus]|uniref:AA9 family lytic polysaccharide monooxygenase n=1 Tax=Coprinellus micaceus TaxID=71717 RepID=A0A4Y7SKN0_COPMI|nr:hypothetical protein FA13DRAFT_1641619 [Coprinellus micaceus]